MAGGNEESAKLKQQKKKETKVPSNKIHELLKQAGVPNDGTCLYCQTNDSDELKVGRLLQDEASGITVHHYCLLFASGLSQRGREHQGIEGFLPEDIIQEFRRAKRLVCRYCMNKGATIGCVIKRCPLTFHFHCGFANDTLSQFFGNFNSFCLEHRPSQETDPMCCSPSKSVCPICVCDVPSEIQVNVLKTPCCNNLWLHRECIQRQALSSGYFFRCPVCNNKDVFEEEMKKFGIYIPEQDASWEREDGAFQDLLERHQQCDSEDCLCPKGRTFNKGKQWTIMLCDLCGSQGCHVKCGRLKNQSKEDWACWVCRTMVGSDLDSKKIKSTSSLTKKQLNSPPYKMKLQSKTVRTPLPSNILVKSSKEENSIPVLRFSVAQGFELARKSAGVSLPVVGLEPLSWQEITAHGCVDQLVGFIQLRKSCRSACRLKIPPMIYRELDELVNSRKRALEDSDLDELPVIDRMPKRFCSATEEKDEHGKTHFRTKFIQTKLFSETNYSKTSLALPNLEECPGSKSSSSSSSITPDVMVGKPTTVTTEVINSLPTLSASHLCEQHKRETLDVMSIEPHLAPTGHLSSDVISSSHQNQLESSSERLVLADDVNSVNMTKSERFFSDFNAATSSDMDIDVMSKDDEPCALNQPKSPDTTTCESPVPCQLNPFQNISAHRKSVDRVNVKKDNVRTPRRKKREYDYLNLKRHKVKQPRKGAYKMLKHGKKSDKMPNRASPSISKNKSTNRLFQPTLKNYFTTSSCSSGMESPSTIRSSPRFQRPNSRMMRSFSPKVPGGKIYLKLNGEKKKLKKKNREAKTVKSNSSKKREKVKRERIKCEGHRENRNEAVIVANHDLTKYLTNSNSPKKISEHEIIEIQSSSSETSSLSSNGSVKTENSSKKRGRPKKEKRKRKHKGRQGNKNEPVVDMNHSLAKYLPNSNSLKKLSEHEIIEIQSSSSERSSLSSNGSVKMENSSKKRGRPKKEKRKRKHKDHQGNKNEPVVDMNHSLQKYLPNSNSAKKLSEHEIIEIQSSSSETSSLSSNGSVKMENSSKKRGRPKKEKRRRKHKDHQGNKNEPVVDMNHSLAKYLSNSNSAKKLSEHEIIEIQLSSSETSSLSSNGSVKMENSSKKRGRPKKEKRKRKHKDHQGNKNEPVVDMNHSLAKYLSNSNSLKRSEHEIIEIQSSSSETSSLLSNGSVKTENSSKKRGRPKKEKRRRKHKDHQGNKNEPVVDMNHSLQKYLSNSNSLKRSEHEIIEIQSSSSETSSLSSNVSVKMENSSKKRGRPKKLGRRIIGDETRPNITKYLAHSSPPKKLCNNDRLTMNLSETSPLSSKESSKTIKIVGRLNFNDEDEKKYKICEDICPRDQFYQDNSPVTKSDDHLLSTELNESSCLYNTKMEETESNIEAEIMDLNPFLENVVSTQKTPERPMKTRLRHRFTSWSSGKLCNDRLTSPSAVIRSSRISSMSLPKRPSSGYQSTRRSQSQSSTCLFPSGNPVRYLRRQLNMDDLLV